MPDGFEKDVFVAPSGHEKKHEKRKPDIVSGQCLRINRHLPTVPTNATPWRTGSQPEARVNKKPFPFGNRTMLVRVTDPNIYGFEKLIEIEQGFTHED